MRTGEPKRTSAIILGLIILMLMMLALPAVFADEGHGHHHDGSGDVTVDNVLTGGDSTNSAVINGGRSYGVAGSDMDIGQCVYHVGGLTVAVGLRNKFCEGMEMIRSGMVDAGVLHICKQTKIGRNYDTLKDCQDGMVMYAQSQSDHAQDDSSMSEQSQDDEEDRVDVLYALFSDLEAQRNEDKAEAEKAAQRPIPQPQTIIQQQEFINESKRAKLAALRDEK